MRRRSGRGALHAAVDTAATSQGPRLDAGKSNHYDETREAQAPGQVALGFWSAAHESGPPPQLIALSAKTVVAGEQPASARYTAEELAAMPEAQLAQVIPASVRARIPLSVLGAMEAEELLSYVPVRRPYALSLDFSPQELAAMSKDELARVVQPKFIAKFGLEKLAALTPDELALAIPTNLWSQLPPPRTDVPRLTIRGPGGRTWDSLEAATADIGNAAVSDPWVVVYAPHPDDETYGIGAYTNYLRLLGYNVYVVLMTHGEESNIRRAVSMGCCYVAGGYIRDA